MKEPFTITGYWWLPGIENKKLPGTLSFSQDNGIYLEVLGIFEVEKLLSHNLQETILGVSQDGKPVTLQKCLNVSSNLSFGRNGVGKSKFKSHLLFIGAHFSTISETKFHTLYGSFTDLDIWVGIHGFDIQNDRQDETIISYKKPASQFFQIDDCFSVGISFSAQGPNQTIVQSDVSICQQTFLVIKSLVGDGEFQDLYTKLNIFSYLVQIATQRTPYMVSLSGISSQNYIERKDKAPLYPLIDIYFQPIEPYKQKKTLIPQDLLFDYRDCSDEQIRRWFTTFDKHQKAIHLYRALFYEQRLFIEAKFLNMAQALEVLHSSLFGGQQVGDDELSGRISVVLQNIPDELKPWVKNALLNSNFKPFKQKIHELLENKSSYFSDVIDDLENFSARVRDTRNEFVHLTTQKKTFKDSLELLTAINLLTLLFEIYLLDLIGFSDDKVQELIAPKKLSWSSGWKHLRTRSVKK